MASDISLRDDEAIPIPTVSQDTLEYEEIFVDSGCTNKVVGGFGPHYSPSGLGVDSFKNPPISVFSKSSSPPGISPPVVGDVSIPLVDLGRNGFNEFADVSLLVPASSSSTVAYSHEGGAYATGSLERDGGSNCVTNCSISTVVSESLGQDVGHLTSPWPDQSIVTSKTVLCDQLDCTPDRILSVDIGDKSYTRMCGLECQGSHVLEGVSIQLNPCSFFDECFLNESGVDSNAEYIYEGVRNGFNIVDQGFSGSYCCKNYNSILDEEFSSQMDSTLAEELQAGKVSLVEGPPTCVHALGAVRKANGKLRPITDCRRPEGDSINNYMTTTCNEFTFTKLDSVAEYMTGNCWFAVLDLKSAYRTVHIAPSDRQFQGFVWHWQGKDRYFRDNCLCFGLRCAPYIFSRLTEFIIRCMSRRGADGIFGYLDDFLVVGRTEQECNSKLLELIALLRHLGFAISWEKLVSPSRVVTYLGIELDSEKMEFRLPSKKVTKIKNLLSEFESMTHATKKELQVIAGYLSHASTVVRGGRTFSRRLLNVIKYFPDSKRKIPLPDWLFPDLGGWSKLFETFNGTAKVIKSLLTASGYAATDSSMSGFGGVWSDDWFVGVWDGSLSKELDVPSHHLENPPDSYHSSMNINILELWPVLTAANRWGVLWRDKKVRILTDNTQVVQMINTGRSSSVECMFWIRELFWISVLYNFHLVASHISTDCNVVPDYLSRCSDKKTKKPHPSYTGFLCCFRNGVFEKGPVYVPTELAG